MYTKLIIALFSLLVHFNLSAQTVSCANDRYNSTIFATPNLNNLVAIPFGQNTNYMGNNEALKFVLLQPPNDTAAYRPLMIWAFGGAFVSGSKDSPQNLDVVRRFSEYGYAVASIDYRIGMNQTNILDLDGEYYRATIRGMHDMKAAIRFFYKSARTGNPYKIDTNNILIGGYSAGSILSMMAAYLDTDEVPSYLQTDLDAMGGLAGNSGNPGYPEKVKALINVAGVISDTAIIDADEPPVVCVHGTADNVCPINVGKPLGLAFLPDVQGSNLIYDRMLHLNKPTDIYRIQGAGHADIGVIEPYKVQAVTTVSQFLYPLICQNQGTTTLGITDNTANSIEIYPNPSKDIITIKAINIINDIALYNAQGQLVTSYTPKGYEQTIAVGHLPIGMYFLKLDDSPKVYKIIHQ